MSKELVKSFSKFVKLVKPSLKFLWVGFYLFINVVISVFAGMGSESIIYSLNKPLGAGYAHFASYAISALTLMILNPFEK